MESIKIIFEFLKKNATYVGWFLLLLILIIFTVSTCSSCKSYNALKLENSQKDITIGQYIQREYSYQQQIKTLQDTLVVRTHRIENLLIENNEMVQKNYVLSQTISKMQKDMNDSISILVPMVRTLPNVMLRIMNNNNDVYKVKSVEYKLGVGWEFNY